MYETQSSTDPNTTPPDSSTSVDALHHLAVSSLRRFEEKGDLSNLADSISLLEKAIALSPGDEPLPELLIDLGLSFFRRFECTGNIPDISEAISAQRRAVQLTPDKHPNASSYFNDLGLSLLRRFERLGEIPDLTEAIDTLQKASELTPETHPAFSNRLTNLGIAFMRRFELKGGFSDIDNGISSFKRAVQATPESNMALPARLCNLGTALSTRHTHSGDLSDLSEAISLQQRAVDLTPNDHPDFAGRLTLLGSTYLRRFFRQGDLSDISEAISLQRRSVDLTPEGHADLPRRLNNLGHSLSQRFRRTGNPSDIAEAISLHEQAISITPNDHFDLPHWLNNLGTAIMGRFERFGDTSDVSSAIDALKKAVELTPDGHIDLPRRLNNLGNMFGSRFQRSGQLSDINEAISLQQQAVAITPPDHPELPDWVNNLGISLIKRFDRLGNLADIDKAIDILHRGVTLTPGEHPDLPWRLGTAGSALSRRYERVGDLADIAEAITLNLKAVDLTPGQDENPELPGRLGNLARSFKCRFERTNEISDIAEAISLHRRAVGLTPEGHPSLAARLNDLGNAVWLSFEHTGDIDVISESIALREKALELAPDSPDVPGWLNNLGNSFSLRFERTGSLKDMENAVSAQRRAVDSAPESHIELPTWLNNLAVTLLRRFERLGDPSDADEAVSILQRALDLTPEGHSYLPHLLMDLGRAWSHKSRLPGNNDMIQDRTTSISCFKTAATSMFGPPSTRLRAAVCWAGELLRKNDTEAAGDPEVIEAFECAVALIALVAGLEQTVQARYKQLQAMSGVALQAASAALTAGRVDKALEWLEQGRCLVWSQLSNLRTPVDDLRTHDSALAQRVADVSRQLERASSSRMITGSNSSLMDRMTIEDESCLQLALAREWDSLLGQVRGIPGFETFLAPPLASNIQKHIPQSGYVVVINIDERRCDAIALSTAFGEPLHIPLPKFTLENARSCRRTLDVSLERGRLRMRGGEEVPMDSEDGIRIGERGARLRKRVNSSDESFSWMLRELWNRLVKPIVEALGLQRQDTSPGDLPPRIWWCPTGPLSFLPIHAAGVYTNQASDSLFDYAISSYTPTITALNSLARTSNQISTEVAGLFLTSQPSAPRLSKIPGTTTEVNAIHYLATSKHPNGRILKLEGNDVSSVADCLAHMQNYSIVHLACHASQNASDPLQSQFHFHTGSLTLHDLIQANLQNVADFAFLSACQTSAGEEKLSDEAVHLAAGMLAAGYRRVVATMWSIKDEYAPGVAEDFYSYLWDNGESNEVDGSRPAEALHFAIQNLRRSLDHSDRSLLTWAPYVHFGY